MPYQPWYPDPGSYIRYFDYTEGAKQIKYRHLIWRRDTFVYPRRLASVAVGSKGDSLNFDELNPSQDKSHLYLAYLGVKPGFLYHLYHPVDVRSLKWDETIREIDVDRTGFISYEMSPYEHPTKAIGIDRDRYPGVAAINIGIASAHPEVVWMAALYLFKKHEELTPDEKAKLASGAIRSYPWDFGGEV